MKRPMQNSIPKVRLSLRRAAVLMIAGLALILLEGMTAAQTSEPGQGPASESARADLTQQPTLFVIGYAHLDTEWRWEYPQVIREYLSKTMRNNFALFDKYPHYIFNFTGSNRYEMMKEYYPADFARLKRYVAAGRWFPAGSSVEENDVNSPSAESIIRQVLHGNEFFRNEFGKASDEYMLPDCFGFPASLPSILAHAGIRGFSTQKLSAAWQPAPHVGGPDSPEKTPEGIPFNVGLWEGPDGRTVLAALNPGSYDGDVYTDLTKNNTPPAGQQGGDYVWDWPDRVNLDGKVTGIYADYHYVGTGDIGGSPNEGTVKLMEAIETKSETPLPSIPSFGSFEEQQPAKPSPPVRLGTGPLRVVWSDADTLFGEIQPSQTSRMPRYKGDLELINHSAGSLTSQAYHKRWNRENEVLADAAEKASVGAAWLGGQAYPQARLNRAWRLVLGGQFHDIMAGTATPHSYVYSWNDDVLALNQFAGVLTAATQAVASLMDTQAQGTPVVVFNQLNIPRQDVVEAQLSFPQGAPEGVRVLGPDGQEVPAQLEPGSKGSAKVVFLASVPSVGYAVYDIQPTGAPPSSSTSRVSSSFLENARYRVQIDDNGDVSGIFDKKLNRELLSAPLRLAISTDNPSRWPAWNMDFEDEQRPPRAYVGGPAHVRVVEQGPARVAVEISREGENSKFVQTIRLPAGDAGNRVEVVNAIDWAAKQANLKETFPLSASNPMATYNWDIGTIERPNETLRQFEVGSHRWIDLTDRSGSYGVTILTDAKNGSDKPSDNTLRLTLLRTPGTRGGYEDQGTQDWGRHEFVFGLAGHQGDWRRGQTDWQAHRLNEPLIAFETSPHPGALGKEFSLLRVSSSRVRVMAMKKAEENDLVIVRLVEISGRAEPDVHLTFAGPVTAAREVNGQEQPLGPATIENGELVTSFSAYQPLSFAVELAPSRTQAAAPESQPVTLYYDASVATLEGRPGEGCFDCDLNNQTSPQGNALPAEMLPSQLSYGGIQFQLAPAGLGKPEAVTAQGQTIQLPAGDFNRLYLLAAAYGGDQEATFQVASPSTVSRIGLNIEDWGGYIGQWDTRIWNEKKVEFRVPSEPAPDDKSPRAQRARRIRAYVKEHGPIFRTEMEYAGLKPAYVKRAPVAWFASHHHAADGANEPYSYSYLFAYDLDLPAGATALTLPDNKRIRLLAATVAKESPRVTPAHPLYDTLERANIDMGRWNASLNPMNPASLAFGAAPVGSASQPQSVTLTNTRSEDLTVRDIQISGDFSQSNDCATLHPGARCTIQVTFQPAAVGTRSGTLTVPGNASENLAVALTGTGLGGASAKVGFGDGFFGPGLQSLALNGNASIFHRRLRLTDGGDQEAASAFTSNLVNVASFTNDFSFQLTDADADGFTFAIQADSPRVVGPPGGGLGYGPNAPGGQPSGIPKSVAVKFDLWSNAGESSDGTGMYTDGASPTVPDVDLSDKGIDLHNGDIFYVHMAYDGAILAWTITDSATGRSFSTSAPLNISRVLGANTGYVGFTAATGGLASTQEILAWTFQ